MGTDLLARVQEADSMTWRSQKKLRAAAQRLKKAAEFDDGLEKLYEEQRAEHGSPLPEEAKFAARLDHAKDWLPKLEAAGEDVTWLHEAILRAEQGRRED